MQLAVKTSYAIIPLAKRSFHAAALEQTRSTDVLQTQQIVHMLICDTSEEIYQNLGG